EKIDELMEEGLSRQDATQRAHREFGNVTLIEERSRDVWRWPRLEATGTDAKYAVRQLWRSPGFTLAVVLTLALSIGANTRMFSIVNALLLKSLSYNRPERLGTIFARMTGPQPSDMRRHIDGEQWEQLRDNVPSLISAASGLRTSGVNLQAGSQVQYLQA